MAHLRGCERIQSEPVAERFGKSIPDLLHPEYPLAAHPTGDVRTRQFRLYLLRGV